jgi:caffeoyl-CoA O-methyltransferase
MEKTFAQTDPAILAYVNETFEPEDAALRRARERAERLGIPAIQVSPMDGRHLEVIARALGARRIVEIGTLAGYSGIHLARGLAAGGVLHTFEYEPRHAEAAAEAFRDAGVSRLVRLHVGAALENLPKIERDGPFDLVFIDADKESYPAYLDWAARNLRVGGAVLADNTFAFGMIADRRFETAEDERAVSALREFNREAARGGRFRATMLPTGEGLTFAVKVR